MIRAGDLRHQVEIQQRSTEQDSTGEQLNVWTTFARRRASVDRTPGREVFAAAERAARVPTVFRLRGLDGVTPAMRVVWQGQVFNIVSAIDQSGRGEELVISTEELVGDAP